MSLEWISTRGDLGLGSVVSMGFLMASISLHSPVGHLHKAAIAQGSLLSSLQTTQSAMLNGIQSQSP